MGNTGINKRIAIDYSLFYKMAGGYLLLPVLIYMVTFLKLYIGIPFALLMIFSFVLVIRDSKNGPDKEKLELKPVGFPIKYLIIIGLIAILLSVATGVGEYVWTTYDHAFRRALLRDMIDYSWPIIYNPATQTNPDVIAQLNMNSGDIGFVYYLSFWMPAALVGKLLGFAAANVFLVLWNSFGIFITLVGMCLYCRRSNYAVFWAYLCFSGLDCLPNIVYHYTQYSDWWWVEGWVKQVSYISNINSLMNVYSQCVPCWLIVVMILLATNTRSLGFTGALVFAYSPWATIGMVPVAIVRLFDKKIRGKNTKTVVRNVFTVTNILPAALMVLSYAPYYMAKGDAVGYNGFVWDFFGSMKKFIVVYVLVFVIEVLPAAGVIFKRQRRDPMYWVAVISLLIFPIYKITEMNDLMMRGSMPALFILTVMLARMISEITAEDQILLAKKAKRKGKENLRLVILSGVIVGMMYMTYFMGTVVYAATLKGLDRPDNAIVSYGNISTPEYVYKINDQFFVYDYEDTFFYKHMAR